MTDLKPCPFCGAVPEVIADRVTTWGLVEHKEGCFFPSWPKHEIRTYDWEAWNTRYKRTCEMEQSFIEPSRLDFMQEYRCSECGEYGYMQIVCDGDGVKYCPNCGAKVTPKHSEILRSEMGE